MFEEASDIMVTATPAVLAATSFESDSPKETRRIAATLAKNLKGGSVVALFGELGSGKTTFVKGMCRALNVRDDVTSPTFTLIQEYSGTIPIYHFDFYRIEEPAEMLQLGCEEYFYGDGICLIEWPERIIDYLPENRTEVRLTHRFSEGLDCGRRIVIRKL